MLLVAGLLSGVLVYAKDAPPGILDITEDMLEKLIANTDMIAVFFYNKKEKGEYEDQLEGLESIDDDLDSYWTNKDAPEAARAKKVEASKGSLDDDLDSYFAAKSSKAEE